jgi:hypothetical protein
MSIIYTKNDTTVPQFTQLYAVSLLKTNESYAYLKDSFTPILENNKIKLRKLIVTSPRISNSVGICLTMKIFKTQ